MVERYNKGKGKGLQFLRDHVGDADGPCLIWPLCCDDKGYGQGGFNGLHMRASRMMCILVHGPAPSDEHEAAHSCGNGHLACVHPKHVSWKTPSENHFDRRAHGTATTNPTGNRTKLRPEQVAEIRSLVGKLPLIKIGRRFGISDRTVGRIRDGKQYLPAGMSKSSIQRRTARAHATN